MSNSNSDIVVIKVLSPSKLPTSKVGNRPKNCLRISKNCVFFSAGLIEEMSLVIGDKVNFAQKGDFIYVYPTDIDDDDSYTLKGKNNEMQFSHTALANVILKNYGVFSLIENRTFKSYRFDIVKKSMPIMVAGVDTYWEIQPCKKYEKP